MTFQKRQKEFKRREKQRAKAERREQKKFAKRAAKEAQGTPTTTSWTPNSNLNLTKGRSQEKNLPSGWKLPCFAAQLIKRDLF